MKYQRTIGEKYWSDYTLWNWKSQKDIRPMVLLTGCMDMMHRGHIALIEYASREWPLHFLMVAVNTDSSVAQLKPGRPIIGLADRQASLASLQLVDGVTHFGECNVAQLLLAMAPEVWVKGGDYTLKTLNKLEVRAARKAGTKIHIAPRFEYPSTTDIINKIKKLKTP